MREEIKAFFEANQEWLWFLMVFLGMLIGPQCDAQSVSWVGVHNQAQVTHVTKTIKERREKPLKAVSAAINEEHIILTLTYHDRVEIYNLMEGMYFGDIMIVWSKGTDFLYEDDRCEGCDY